MSHVTLEASWCTIDIDTEAGKVVVIERWQYVWNVASARVPRWTLAEKRTFHARAEREIWNAWSNRAHLKVEGSSDFAKRFRGREIPVFMDIRWVLAKPHWTVEVMKIPDDGFIRSKVPWGSQTIRLDTNDFKTRTTCFGADKPLCVSQIPIAHEFGHTLGSVRDAMANLDEYRKQSEHGADVHSIMHRGSQLRDRHFEQLLTELYDLIPETSFSVGRLQ